MKTKLFLIGLLSGILVACGGNPAANSNSNIANGVGNTANATNATNTNLNSNANSNVNVNSANTAAKPSVDNSPKRISFGKGANWGTANVTLAPGATQLFVVGAKSGQTMDVESSSRDLAINLRKGKAETTEDFGYLNAELQSSGDFVFEVKNTTKKELKSSIKVTIEGGQPKTDGEGQGADDGDKPEPSNKKAN